jgi:hypothetical protein
MGSDNKELASKVIKEISTFIIEFEESKLLPNAVLLGPQAYEALKLHFPYLFLDSHTICYNNKKFKVVIAAEAIVGLCYSYHTDYEKELESCEHTH